jgi:hypothetical protein
MDSDEDDCTAEMPALTADGPGSSSEGVQTSTVICERELRQHFHLPLHTAAQKFGICTTAFKKLCRRFGIAKWPHRQLRGIDKKIAALKAELNWWRERVLRQESGRARVGCREQLAHFAYSCGRGPPQSRQRQRQPMARRALSH